MLPLPFSDTKRPKGLWRAMLAAAILFGVGHIHGHAQSDSTRSVTSGIRGRVQDPSGAIVPGASVALTRSDGSAVASAASDPAGEFRLPQPLAGEYRLSVEVPGFEPLTRALRVGKGAVTPLALTLKLANVSTTVSVDATEDVEATDPERNGDAASVSSSDMKSLPVFDGDIVATLSTFLDTNVAGETGPTLMVDGVSRSSVGVAASAIERVSINQDPFSAVYWQPGRGQVEIVTKSTADRLHGSASFTFRDGTLDATNRFAPSKAPEQRRIYEGFLTGPIRPLRDTAFLFSATRSEEDIDNQVIATALGTPSTNVPAPMRSTALSMKVSHQFSARHSAYAIYRFLDMTKRNAYVGGQTLESAGQVALNYDQDLTFHDDFALSPTRFNQFSLLLIHNRDTNTDTVEAPQIVIQGVATFGSAQVDMVNTENSPDLTDVFSLSFGGKTHTLHQLKLGIQMPNMGRRVVEDHTNWQGTYTFSSLAAYKANRPSTFNIQQGQPRWVTWYLQPGMFIQDQIQATKRLTVTAGLRYDWQNAFPKTRNALEPRLSLAYLLEKRHALVVRVGGGLYVRRVGFDVNQRLARYESAGERNLVLTTAVCYPNCTPLATVAPSLFVYAPNLKSPEQSYFSLSMERQLTKGSTITLGYNGFRGWHAVLSTDINAPLPPFTSATRPNPNYGQIFQLQSRGTQKSDGFNVSYRGRIGNAFSGFVQYGFQHSDRNVEWSEFNPQNMYAPLSAEWSRGDMDQRQRLSLLGTFFPDKLLNLGIGFNDYTPLPYTITTGTDDYRTGILNARPAGVARNSLNGGNYQDVQLRWGYSFKLHPQLKDASPAIAVSVASFNTLNRVNYSGYVGVVSSPSFMQPTAAWSPRRIQLSCGYSF